MSTATLQAPAALTCADCGRPLTPGQTTLSLRHYGRPLCPPHQKTPGRKPAPAPARDVDDWGAAGFTDADAPPPALFDIAPAHGGPGHGDS